MTGLRSAEIKAKEELGAFLSRERARAVYFIGDLDDKYFPRCRWWGHRREGDGLDALVLLYAHPIYPTILTLGDSDGMQAILEERRHLWPKRFHAHLLPEHALPFERHYRVSQKSPYFRMAVNRDEASGCTPSDDVVPLKIADDAAVANLLREYPEAFYSTDDLNSGYYFGIYREETLASMAGIHVVSAEYGVAALGNVVTRPAFRRQGLARRCTAHLLHELFKTVDVVALNVKDDNASAIRVYERLGFRRHSSVIMGYCERLD